MAMKKSERKMMIREEAKRKIHGGNSGVTGSREYRERIERGRQQLLRKSSEGGDAKGKRIKGELLYLINNYVPSNDTRIVHLIDEWRRSGDPSYDPGIRLALRKARQEDMKKGPL